MFKPKSRPLRQEHYRWMREGIPNFDDRVFEHVKELEMIAKRDVKWVSPTTPIMKALEEMAISYRSLIVISSGLFKGLVTSMKAINYLGGGELFKIIEDRHNYDLYSALFKEKVENIMEENPVFVYIDEGVREALSRMVMYGAGILPVLTRNKGVYGILTEHDFLKYLKGLVSMGLRVKDIMSTPVVTINENSTLKEAMENMVKYGFRRLPVVGENNIVTGIITSMDIVKAIGTHELIEKMNSRDIREILSTPIPEVMREEVIAIDPDSDVTEAVNAMFSRNASSVLVVDNEGVLKGILTERDILYSILIPK